MSTAAPLLALSELEARAGGLQRCSAWARLCDLANRTPALRELLARADRSRAMVHSAAGLHLDFSRQRVDDSVLAALMQLAEERDLGAWISHLFAGAAVNTTERRPALHMALRNTGREPMYAGGTDVMPLVNAELERFLGVAEGIRDGRIRGSAGGRITDVVNIGIGGSDLGLVMAIDALRPYSAGNIRFHFVSNIDGTQLADLTAWVDPETTFFIVCSKSFTTQETRLNADAAREWLVARLGENAVSSHFAAVSVNDPAMDEFGIAPALRFRIWDWVGGRYSLWSAVGLAVATAIGRQRFLELLSGAHELDRHFATAGHTRNLPVLLGLIAVWNQNVLGVQSHAVLPYSARLQRFPAYLQQLEMESNGKGVLRDGTPSAWPTGTVIWGEPGSNGQHAFFQLLHQGTARFSADFIAPARSERAEQPDRHLAGLANMLAQAEALARGRSEREVLAASPDKTGAKALAAQKTHPGNHPSTVILMERLDPRSLGALVALYEHKVFVQSVILGINPFDQWGVELGKTLAGTMQVALKNPASGVGVPAAAEVIVRLRGDAGRSGA
ncbi:MAG: glucose-6-phosphate isomerase [Gammaproteobacteria bacterium]|nr:glucose-6-phosphate isomerase [Gammaproteobacteria bacterium]